MITAKTSCTLLHIQLATYHVQEQGWLRRQMGHHSNCDREEHQGVIQGQCLWHLEAVRPAGHQCQLVPVWQGSDRPVEGNRGQRSGAVRPRGSDLTLTDANRQHDEVTQNTLYFGDAEVTLY